MSFVNQYRSTTIYGELKVQKYNTGNIAGLLDISGNTILQGSCRVDGNIFSNDGTVDISGNLTVSGNIAGTFVANNSTITLDETNASFFPTFVSATTGNLPLKTDTNLSYNPSTNILTVPNITGTCSNSTLATTATNVTIALDATNASFYPMFVSATTGNLPPKVDASFNFNPSTNILTVPNITGTCSNSTLATTATNVTIATDATNASFYPMFVSATTGNLPPKVDASFNFNPSTNILTVPKIICNYVGGVWCIDGTNTGSVNALVPFFTSQPDLSDINNQSTLTYTAQSGTAVGSYVVLFNNLNKFDRIAVFPKWGIIGYNGINYTSVIDINFKNIYDYPVYIDVANNVMSSCKIFCNDILQ